MVSLYSACVYNTSMIAGGGYLIRNTCVYSKVHDMSEMISIVFREKRELLVVVNVFDYYAYGIFVLRFSPWK